MFTIWKSRKDQDLGNRQIRYKFFDKSFDVTNYNPQPFCLTVEWANYLNNASKHFGQIIAKAQPDDLCDTMLDTEIEAQMLKMKASAAMQLQNHLRLISHNQGVLNGERIRSKAQLNNLTEDLAEIQKQLETIKTMKENGGK